MWNLFLCLLGYAWLSILLIVGLIVGIVCLASLLWLFGLLVFVVVAGGSAVRCCYWLFVCPVEEINNVG